MARKEVHTNSGRRAGCFALVGLVLIGAALLTAIFGLGVQSGVLRSDHQGLLLLAGILCLVGVGVFASAAFRGGGRGQL